jgi:hypothetical protein
MSSTNDGFLPSIFSYSLLFAGDPVTGATVPLPRMGTWVPGIRPRHRLLPDEREKRDKRAERQNGGAPSGFRTPDPLIKSQLLYQLS